ncbi:pre-mRNA-splicing factor ATP-dependent RNA helicase DEAH10 [Vigna radiata var. radiata]|uniref:RNA helicase n=1 Tax=Vigna radiata var. radiata TaxID=3916 RepID=A0A1S3TAA8_VIGRR|nr:pre-mRNA-splicing factor ATP-dependent RNA helicase DEAH10 [Vigna radiata var. radiata]XP_014490700.1 pre-mRNA-splicing factor ATP-dependent RNA helicase DEAH10 [Vigna radiata var. radiata]XP_014490701.1 pre-mRNA-splicing factor ATP-dependent RNA helicase DEAH10 [Vigna radiata var. radiata]XP_022633234.1 pre-mRNA-splicing factor ATP-dependent RNA helicase DEAH10 [Vigna radiata var. radiata]XP_022633235.1 pre-mRNA-splicing factor ATP-dependent RNA helicase DEAH10 [Vigna radiata var. radiata]
MPSVHRGNFPNRQTQFSARRQKIMQQKKSLPIASVEKRLVEEVRKNDVLIIVGETGSGKTTQIPQFLFDAGFCRDGRVIGITQPRRVAAVTVAKRVAEECGVELGQKVGYSVRFDDATSASTRIKYMTDGLLLREALLDPYLSKYSVIIVDEAHERTVHTDVLMGLLKNVQLARSSSASDGQGLIFGKENSKKVMMSEKENDQSGRFHKMPRHEKYAPLKLIIMSASLDARAFSEYFGGAKAVHIQGRQFPVDIFYTRTAETDYLDASLITIFQIHLEEGPGDILVFLTGQEEIESVERLINEKLPQLPQENQKLLIVPIFAALPSEQQMRVFAPAPSGFRKVILATNIAETSVTIPGIKYVIDPGFVKARSYDPGKGMESLIIVPTSKSQALQRSGRAGREGPGKCFRLYPEKEFEKLEDSTMPEIKRCNLSNVILQLKALGVDDILGFDFIEKPSRAAITKSLEELFLLGALTDKCLLSEPVGHQMARLPLDPIYSKALILASEFNCLEEMLITVALLSVESIFYSPRDKLEEARTATKCFSSPEGDHITLINVYRASNDFLEKRSMEMGIAKTEKVFRKWCKENYVNSRSLRHARDIHKQIKGHVEQMGLNLSSCGDDMLQFRRCLAASFFLNAAVKQPEGTYRALASGQVVQIHPSSVLFRKKPECVIFNELVQTNNKYVRNLTRVDYLWLTELAPQYYAMQN